MRSSTSLSPSLQSEAAADALAGGPSFSKQEGKGHGPCEGPVRERPLADPRAPCPFWERPGSLPGRTGPLSERLPASAQGGLWSGNTQTRLA